MTHLPRLTRLSYPHSFPSDAVLGLLLVALAALVILHTLLALLVLPLLFVCPASHC